MGDGSGMAGVTGGRFLEVETHVTCARFAEPSARAACAVQAFDDEAKVFDGMAARGEQIAARVVPTASGRLAAASGHGGVSLRAPQTLGAKSRAAAFADSEDVQRQVTHGKVEAAYQSWLAEKSGR